MKVLHFHAVASHPKVAPALLYQTSNTLRAFDHFLNQAICAANQRQYRYKLPWERVRHLRTLGLEPIETIFIIPKSAPGWFIKNWPPEVQPDLNQQLMVVNRGAMIEVTSFEFIGEELCIQTKDALLPEDNVWWCNVNCEIDKRGKAAPPQELCDLADQKLKVLGVSEQDESSWLVRVDGKHEHTALIVDGQEMQCEQIKPFSDLKLLFDTAQNTFEFRDGLLKVEEFPEKGQLRGDNGINFRWHDRDKGKRKGLWIQILLPEDTDSEAFLDPRAAFCESDVSEVWTQPKRYNSEQIKVKRVDRERYQLLVDRLPPDDANLYLPVDVRNLQLQRRALRQLSEAPLPHHAGLLRLCETPEKVRWPTFTPQRPTDDGWYCLTQPERDGTEQQREFVARALASTDFSLLEGPPGSGKTTAICELVEQLVRRDKRVLLCASTHVAIDNVIERLLENEAPVDVVRIGTAERVDRNVQECQIDNRVEQLLESWKDQPQFRLLGKPELKEMAERTVIMSANLTCGTTMGIVNHPLFRDQDRQIKIWERPIAKMPHWDVLIIDEASKTMIQEFMVPALMARRWVIVGDIRQLPPFTERANIVANLRGLLDDKGRELFSPDHQRACILLWKIGRFPQQQPGVRWLIAEPPGVLNALEEELLYRDSKIRSVRLTSSNRKALGESLQAVTIDDLKSGRVNALYLAAADWVLVSEELLPEISHLLPSTLLRSSDLTRMDTPISEADPFFFRQQYWLQKTKPLSRTVRVGRKEITSHSELQKNELDWLSRKDWASEIAWRLTRIHELKRSHNQDIRERYLRNIEALLPATVDISEAVMEIREIGLPSILEVMQEGIGKEHSKRLSALTVGFKAENIRGELEPKQVDHLERAFVNRFSSLSWQHRMHPTISTFPRDVVYQNEALQDANTIGIRDSKILWDFAPELGSRRVWVDVDASDYGGINQREVDKMAEILKDFHAWAKHKGPPQRERPQHWEVACLCFYLKQEGAIRKMLQELTNDNRITRFRWDNIEIVCGTVDRFQGREADLAILSMRNTRRIGFLDSVNRLNVAVTRARQQLMVLGKLSYFSSCDVFELEELARRSTTIDERRKKSRRRR